MSDVTERLANRLYLHEADAEDALKLFEKNLARQIRLFGVDGGGAANARAGVAGQLEKMGRFDEARLLRQEVLAAFRRNRGDEDRYTLLQEEWLAVNLAKSGLHEEARVHLVHIRDGYIRTFGPEHEYTQRVVHNLRIVSPGDDPD